MMKWIQNLSFKTRIFLCCLIVAMIPLVVSSLLMNRLFASFVRKQVYEEGTVQLDKIEESFSTFLNKCDSACQGVVEESSALRVLLNITTDEIEKEFYVSLYQEMQNVYSYAQFNIYDSGGKLRFTTEPENRREYLPTYWGLLKRVGDAKTVTYYRTDPYLDLTESDIFLQGVYPVESETGLRTGYLVLDLSKASFENILQGLYGDGWVVLILDSYRNPVYCSNDTYDADDINHIIDNTIDNIASDKMNNAYDQYLWKQESHGFYIIMERKSPITAPLLKVNKTVNFSLGILSLLLCMGAARILTRSVIYPVNRLSKAMQKASNGDLTVKVPEEGRDELGELGKSFNRMVIDLRKYIAETVQKQKDLNNAQIKLYQTQLNPHFLYNTMDTIKWSAKIKDVPEVAILAENLAVILRRCLSSKQFITLETELETIESYVEIQKIRFVGRFLYETEIAEQLEDCLVPKMILQPLVENAIIHGLDGSENGYICVYASQIDSKLQISVTDNGCGMSEEMVAWINQDDPPKRDGHIGLYNVIQILKLHYGQEYRLKVTSTNEGVTATISLPIQRKESHV